MEKRCVVCGSTTTYMDKAKWKSRRTGEVKEKITAHWYGTDKYPICGRCWARERERRKHEIPEGTKCEQCGSSETRIDQRFGTPAWKKTETGYICWSCHITNINTGRNVSDETREKMRQSLTGHQHTPETKAKMSLISDGESNAFYQHKHTPEVIAEHAAAISGENNRFYGQKRPDHAKFMKGDNNPNWKEGITPLNHQIRTCDKYKEWRKAVYEKDNHTCQECGDDSGGNLHGHHIKRFSVIIAENKIQTFEQAMACMELWGVNNGRTLCEECHEDLVD